jgi:hypothetical protein
LGITKRMREMVNAKFAWQWSAGDDEFLKKFYLNTIGRKKTYKNITMFIQKVKFFRINERQIRKIFHAINKIKI